MKNRPRPTPTPNEHRRAARWVRATSLAAALAALLLASGAAHEAEDLMKENLAASFVLALGLGVVVGYFIRRGTE